MRTVALDPGGGGESLGDGEPPVGPRGGESAARAVLSGEIVEAEDPRRRRRKLAGGLSVSVADPQMSLAAGSPFGKKVVTYKVRVVVRDPAAFPEYKARDTAVWRRFRDFVALADLLRESHKGYFVPPRPEKKPLSLTADDAFVRDRTHQLGAYLDKLARHPACRNAAELRVFLTAPDLERDPEWLAFAHLRAGVSPPSAGARLPAPETPALGSSADADTSSLDARHRGGRRVRRGAGSRALRRVREPERVRGGGEVAAQARCRQVLQPAGRRPRRVVCKTR